MPEEWITREALNRSEANGRRELQAVNERLGGKIDAEIKLVRQDLQKETELRELTERLGGQALQKAEDFITEKTEEHNNLLSEMRLDRSNFVTKMELEKEKESQHKTILFYISIASFAILIVQNIIGYFTAAQRTAPSPVTVSQPANTPVPVKSVP